MVVELKPRLTFDEYLEKTLSTSPEDFDRDTKIEEHCGVSSLREYPLIMQGRRHVEHYVGQTANQRLLTELDTIYLPSINCHLALSKVYDKVKWPEAE